MTTTTKKTYINWHLFCFKRWWNHKNSDNGLVRCEMTVTLQTVMLTSERVQLNNIAGRDKRPGPCSLFQSAEHACSSSWSVPVCCTDNTNKTSNWSDAWVRFCSCSFNWAFLFRMKIQYEYRHCTDEDEPSLLGGIAKALISQSQWCICCSSVHKAEEWNNRWKPRGKARASKLSRLKLLINDVKFRIELDERSLFGFSLV